MNTRTVKSTSTQTESTCTSHSDISNRPTKTSRAVRFSKLKRPGKCKTCGKVFFYWRVLRMHRKTHTTTGIPESEGREKRMPGNPWQGTKTPFKGLIQYSLTTYECELCTETFTRKTLLDAHMNQKHLCKPNSVYEALGTSTDSESDKPATTRYGKALTSKKASQVQSRVRKERWTRIKAARDSSSNQDQDLTNIPKVFGCGRNFVDLTLEITSESEDEEPTPARRRKGLTHREASSDISTNDVIDLTFATTSESEDEEPTPAKRGKGLTHKQSSSSDISRSEPIRVPAIVVTRQGMFNIHLETHPPETPFQCETCGDTFPTKTSLERHHMTSTHVAEHYLPATFTTPHGNASTRDRGMTGKVAERPSTPPGKGHRYRKTKQQGHTAGRQFKSAFSRANILKRKRHGPSSTPKEQTLRVHLKTKPFKCNIGICDKELTTNRDLEVKKRNHTGDMTHNCKLCADAFRTRYFLKQHLNQKHGIASAFLCEMCGIGFATRDRLWVHLGKHTGENYFKCNTCGEAFPSRYYLKKHRSTQISNSDSASSEKQTNTGATSTSVPPIAVPYTAGPSTNVSPDWEKQTNTGATSTSVPPIAVPSGNAVSPGNTTGPSTIVSPKAGILSTLDVNIKQERPEIFLRRLVNGKPCLLCKKRQPLVTFCKPEEYADYLSYVKAESSAGNPDCERQQQQVQVPVCGEMEIKPEHVKDELNADAQECQRQTNREQQQVPVDVHEGIEVRPEQSPADASLSDGGSEYTIVSECNATDDEEEAASFNFDPTKFVTTSHCGQVDEAFRTFDEMEPMQNSESSPESDHDFEGHFLEVVGPLPKGVSEKEMSDFFQKHRRDCDECKRMLEDT